MCPTGSEEQLNESTELPKVVFIVGSLRKKSFNRQMAEVVKSLFDDLADVEFLEWNDVPIFNQDEEFPAPHPVARVRKVVEAADALWIFSPEYNHSVPGPLKNLLDWLSRPVEVGSPSVIAGKVVTVSGVSGSSNIRYSQAALLPVFDFLEIDVVAAPFSGAMFDREMFTSDRLVLNDASKAVLQNQVDRLLAKIRP